MKHNTLESDLCREILERGPMGFDRFMERALYDPDCGYYGSRRARIGGSGDFFTSVSVGRCYGMLIGREIRRIQEKWGRPGHAFYLIEQGAADGTLMHDIVSQYPGGIDEAATRVLIVEPNAGLRRNQAALLEPILPGRLVHASSWDEVEGVFEGVFFCNELLDAMPVKRVRFENGCWREVRVTTTVTGGGPPTLALTTSDIDDDDLRLQTGKLGGAFPDGYTTEINLLVAPWLRSLDRCLSRGVVMIMDYGFARGDYYHPYRTDGTLRTFHRHRAGSDPLLRVGECDITAHVDFTLVAETAMNETSFDVLGWTDQNHFLMGIGESWLKEKDQANSAAGNVRPAGDPLLRQFQTLTHPGIMGRDFKVLMLGKNLGDNSANFLEGLHYARPCLPLLGIESP